MSGRKAVGCLLAAVLPWPHRAQRKAAIAAARTEARAAQHRAARARAITRDLEAMKEKNHWAYAIARQIAEEGRR